MYHNCIVTNSICVFSVQNCSVLKKKESEDNVSVVINVDKMWDRNVQK